MFRIEDTFTRSCAICGCPIPSVSSKKYCTSCSVTVKSTSMRNRYHKQRETVKITEGHYRNMATVFKRFGYDMPSWEQYAAKHGIKEVQ